MAVEKMRKRKRKFERKRKRDKLCGEEIDVTEELKIVRLLLQIKVLYVGMSVVYQYICVNLLTHGHAIITIKRC